LSLPDGQWQAPLFVKSKSITFANFNKITEKEMMRMKHVRSLALKFGASFGLLYVILGVGYDMAISNVFLISLVLAAASYVIGDLFILPRTNNTTATIADFGLAFMVIWLMGESLTFGESLFTPSLVAAAGIAVFEYFFHKFVADDALEENDGVSRQQRSTYQYQTEASEELSVVKAGRSENEKTYQDLIPASENIYSGDTDKDQTQSDELYPIRPEADSEKE
jgi:hypothetical protein